MSVKTAVERGAAEQLLPQRVSAHASVAVRLRDGRTRLARLHQDGAAKMRMPRSDHDPLEMVLINTAGGLTGGDRLDWTIEVGPNASAVATTQASEKIYRAAAGRAEVSVRLTVAAGARLAWLPQESIMFDRAAFSRRLDVDLAAGGEALIAEATVFGRSAMGEQVGRGSFRDRWRVRVGGRLVHAEEYAAGPDVQATLDEPAALGSARAVATVLLVSEHAEAWLEPVRAIIGEQGGASLWTAGGSGKLLARLYAGDGYHLRKRLVRLLTLLNGQAGLPKCWSL